MALRLLAIALAVGLWVVLASPPDRQINATDDRPVTIATLPCARSLQSTSSGVVYDDEIVVTVAHAIWDSRDFAVRDSAGTWRDAKVLHLDRERDLAVLLVPGLRATPMPTAPGTGGAEVRMVDGAASGSLDGEILRRVRITTQIVGDLSVKSQRSGYELSIPIAGGDSGAAIVDDEDNLVGLIFARSTRRDASWATSIAEIDEIIAERTFPSWECDRPSEVELILEPIEEDRLA